MRSKKIGTKIPPADGYDIKFRPAYTVLCDDDPLSGGYKFHQNGISYNAYPTFPCEDYPYEIPRYLRQSNRKLRHKHRILHRKKKKSTRHLPGSLYTPPNSPPKHDTKLSHRPDTDDNAMQLQHEFDDTTWGATCYDFYSWITNRLSDLRQQLDEGRYQ